MNSAHKSQDQQVCHVCAKVYNSTAGFLQHMRDQTDTKHPRVDCEICGESFKNERSMLTHVKIMHGQEGQSFQCPKCPKISPTEQSLAKHIKTVHHYKVHKCHWCSREFKNHRALKVGSHILIYSYNMYISSTAFILQEHVATHTGEYLYTCAYCPKMFKSNACMFNHYKRSHQAEWNADRKTKPKHKEKN